MADRNQGSLAGPAGGAPAPDSGSMPAICPDPVFIIGSPRAGTTALAQSLAEHSALWASGESHLLSDMFGKGGVERAFERAIVQEPRLLRRERVSREEFLVYVGMGINALITSRSGGLRWIDHTPHYTLIADRLADVFPGARFIHILRDGREVVHSMLGFADSRQDPAVRRFAEQSIAWAKDMGSACATWRDHVEAATAFCGERPERAMVVRYEDLVAAPPATFARIHRFLGIADEEGPAHFLASRRVNSSFGARPRPSAGELWDGWGEERRRTFAELAGATMLKCGYSTPDELEMPAGAARPPR